MKEITIEHLYNAFEFLIQFCENKTRLAAKCAIVIISTIFSSNILEAEARHLTARHHKNYSYHRAHPNVSRAHHYSKHRIISKNAGAGYHEGRHSTTNMSNHFGNGGKQMSGKASIYSDKFNGRKTATGERFSQKGLTAASAVLPIGSKVKVTNKKNGSSVVVKVNDKQPKRGGRVLDLSKSAAHHIGVHDGLADVSTKVIKK